MNRASTAALARRLIHGQFKDFADALRLVQSMAIAEASTFADEGPSPSCLELANAAALTESLYLQRLRRFQLQFAAELQSSDNEDIRAFGRALETGDFSDLAI